MSKYGRANNSQRINFYDAHEWALDKSVTPHTLCYGSMGKDTGGTWRYLRLSSSGALSNDDASNFRISAFNNSSDATDFRVSAFVDSGSISAVQEDASNLRVSAVNTGVISIDNSTTTALGIGATFTGTSEEVKDYAAINVAIWADQDSAADGLSLEWSQDNVNWDEIMNVTIGANKVESYEFGIRARYFRIVYTNGGIAQGAFRLQTIFHAMRTRHGTRCLCVDIDSREFAPTRRAIIAGKKPDGSYTNIHTTAAGNLKVAVEEYDYNDAGEAPVSAFCGDADQLRISSVEMNYKQILAYHTTYTTDVEYIGKGYIGYAASAISAWQIQKLTYLAAGKVSGVMWANGNDNFDCEWDERTNYSYN